VLLWQQDIKGYEHVVTPNIVIFMKNEFLQKLQKTRITGTHTDTDTNFYNDHV